VFAILVERYILHHLVNQEPIILFMATIGLAYFMEGFGDIMWGSDIKTLDVGLPSGGSLWLEEFTLGWAAEGEQYYGMYLDKLDMVASLVAIVLVVSLTIFSQYTTTGRALRAVADDHQAALSVGISLRTIWVIVWSIAGFVALVAGIMWGAKSGVQFSLSLIALKALPVLILGGFTSIPGAIIGGLIIGVGEKLFEYTIGPLVGGATENWFAYVLALMFLVFRPQGLFGEKIIERV
jgi:branched-chain amino acid transport system permease protein